MSYYPETGKIPEGFSTSEFFLRPLLATDFKKDYEAVMATQDLNLRLTEGRWPKNGFTVEENLEDLEYHQKMHEERKEFTFTVMEAGEQHCLGCVYFLPLKSEIADELKIAEMSQGYVSAIYFWLRPDLTTKQFAENFVEKLRQWINTEWGFDNVYYYVRGNSSSEDWQIFLTAGMMEKFRVNKSVYFA